MELPKEVSIERITIFVISFCIGLVKKKKEFTPYKAEQPLRGMELQEKAQKD